MTWNRRDLLLASGALALAPALRAQSFPSRPLKMIYTYAPGGVGDALARMTAASMGNYLGQQVVVENRTGASGSIGVQAGWRAAPDGYTMVMTTITTVVQYPLVTKDNSFDPATSLVPLANLAMNPLCLLVHPSLPVTDFPSFVAWAQQQSGGVDVAVSGPTLEVATALLAHGAKLKFNTIRYRGGAPALQAVLGGEVKVWFESINGAMLANAREGKLRLIAVTSQEAFSLLPDVPPIARFLPGYVQDINFALWAPPGTPAEIVASLKDAIAKAAAEPDMKDKIAKNGVVQAAEGGEYVTRVTRREAAAIKRAMELVPSISYGG
ncbi:tripartite tricarboxylate transporter substrate binding protein [Hydrogenophaga sp.]|uniref:Bug family tripartite tricarboxylate transporter substrate binding protein n=1 Tax=Hydrogenophaga sp. TaxID=1904254 RepID=UPI002639A956|nr:tripartite tricarboxylate transporter substrate binding protein [Hydrogenophaga sp.]MCW5654169.1 tripartite tricarboxylate transporter substrate binding protein [Hydrogenophaga sp.]